MELTYTTTSDEIIGRHPVTFKRSVQHVPTSTATGVVWSPGPLPETVWVLPYSGAAMDQAVVVHAPKPSRTDWHMVEYRPKPIPAYERQVARLAARNAPELGRKTWLAALGATTVAELAAQAAP